MHDHLILRSCNAEHILTFPLTSLGRFGCDIIIDDISADKKHAIIEFCSKDNCYILHDLNTAHGSYVNDCRIQNASVKLSHGDIIKFGHNGSKYEICIENFKKTVENSSQQRWHSPVQIVLSTPRQQNCSDSSTLPHIPTLSSSSFNGGSLQKKSCVQPHPPLRTRPLSASNTTFQDMPKEAWTKSPTADQLQEKDQKLLRMGDELNRLAIFEQESNRKDGTISKLRKEIDELQQMLLKSKNDGPSDMCQKLALVDNELSTRRSEVDSLQRQIKLMNEKVCSTPTLTSQIAQRDSQIQKLRQDLDKFKLEYGMSQGLVQSLQREVQTKETILSQKNSEVEDLRKKHRQKDVKLSSISAKFMQLTEDKTKDESICCLKKQVKELKLKLQTLESRSADQASLLQTYKEEISKIQSKNQIAKQESENFKKEFESLKLKHHEIQRTERIQKIDLEQAKSTFQRFRMRVIRTVYSNPGVIQAEDEDTVEDGKLIGDIKMIIQENLDFKKSIKLLHQQIEESNASFTEIETAHDSCKTALIDILTRLKNNGHHTRLLKHEHTILLSNNIHKNVKWVCDYFSQFLMDECNWLSLIEDSLKKAGFDILLSSKNPAEYVENLYNRLQSEENSHKQTLASIDDMEKRHSDEMQKKIELIHKENEEKLASEVEKLRLEEQMKLEKNMEIVRDKEEQKRLDALLLEREKLASANLSGEQLQKALTDKIAEEEEQISKIEDLFLQIETLKKSEILLQDKVKQLTDQHQVDLLVMSNKLKDLNTSTSENIKQYKEEIRQHSITIITLENQLQNKCSTYENLQFKYKKLLQKSQEQVAFTQNDMPQQSSVNIAELENTISVLKSQLVHATHQIHMYQDSITGLQRDLSGSQARISDMTGELSESQKQELEHNRNVIKQQEIELSTSKQQLLKMIAVVDSQKEEIQQLKQAVRESSRALHQYQEHSKQSETSDEELLPPSSENQSTSISQSPGKTDNSKIATELTSIGALCRGNRHEDIICRQREALAELRARIKALEQIRPPLPSQEQALQQVILLKKELAEIRAKQALDDDHLARAHLKMNKNEIESDQQVRSAVTQASIERTARENLEQCITKSEKSYLDIVNSIAGLLSINSLNGMRSIQHMPQDECEKLVNDRRMDFDLLSSRLKSILQRLDRKEQLLQGYEKDLHKLREAEKFASTKSTKVETLVNELTEKAQEIDHLREALNRVRETLEIEKRLNKAIKQKKTFHLENLDRRQPLGDGHTCYPASFEKTKKQSEKRNEKMRRKQYEIDVLKQSVQGKESDLCKATAQLIGGHSKKDEVLGIYNMRQHDIEQQSDVPDF